MKELSIEEKARRYDGVIKRLEDIVTGKCQKMFMFTEGLFDYIFPELKESEDERIRKDIIHILKGELNYTSKEDISKYIAWLEKQGEQKVPVNDFKAKDWYVSKVDGKIHNLYYNPTDKVEPKFHNGQWITNGDYTWKIVEVKPLDYILQSQDGNIVDDTISHVDEHFHLWTIQDAKDGDVLAAHECLVLFREIDGLNIRCYCTYHFMNNQSFYVDTLQNKDAFHPATEEQRDILFKVMEYEGYTFDFEKKELKKIEQKHAWSEEDEVLLKLSLENLTEIKNRFGEDYGRVGGCIDWLKSLKGRYAWKPTTEQLRELRCVISGCSFETSILVELEENLKKLL